MTDKQNSRNARGLSLDRLSRFVPGITRKAFEKYGFARQDIARHWHDIVGSDIAAIASPERLRWPRSPRAERAVHESGVLVIRVDGPRAIEVQHMAPQIIERVNAYYGYRAVARIKIIQGPLPKPRDHGHPGGGARLPAADLEDACAPIEKPDLKAALKRLARGIAGRTR